MSHTWRTSRRKHHRSPPGMALGARPSQVVGAVVREAAWPVAIGILVGLAMLELGARNWKLL